MFVPYDERAGVLLQDEHFLNRKPWDFEDTPLETTTRCCCTTTR